MDKLKMHSVDGVARNVEEVGRLFPNAVTEVMRDGKVVRAIDFDVLRQELSREIVEGRTERYAFTWPDKSAAILAANAPIAATLRPARAESVGRDGTEGGFDSENLYIEGDNLDVLKLLQETYLGKVKMIYIDPPYNTGNDSFVYDDDFAMAGGDFHAANAWRDEDGAMQYDLRANNVSNGRFHTDWLNMIYPRLRVAKSLLADDGVIFISVDDNEVHNMKKVCDEIFGEINFIATIIWQKIHSIKNDARYFSENHEYVLVYAKESENFSVNLLPRTADMNSRYKNMDNDPRGAWQSGDLVASGERTNGHYIVVSPQTGKEFDVPQGKHWVYSEENMAQLIADNQIWFGLDGNSFPRKKRFLSDVQDGRTPNTLWLSVDVGHNQTATREVKSVFEGEKYFEFPKPVTYLKQMLIVGSDKDALVLDFFSGSATTAHAVMQLNAEDGGHRKFIMVQLPEVTDEKSEAAKAGYANICEIGKERIRRAGAKIATEAGEKAAGLDIGFRCLRLDSTNMNEVYYSPDTVTQEGLFAQVDNVKEDRTPEDLLFQTMLDLGILLSAPIVTEEIAGRRVFNVADGFLLACFDRGVTDETVTAIAKRKPYYAVFRDASMESDSALTNFDQIFAAYSSATVRKVL